MINELIFMANVAAGLVCPKVIIRNKTDVWNDADKAALTTAQKRCGEIYSDAPCVKTFTKTETNVYRVICGAKVSDKKTN